MDDKRDLVMVQWAVGGGESSAVGLALPCVGSRSQRGFSLLPAKRWAKLRLTLQYWKPLR